MKKVMFAVMAVVLLAGIAQAQRPPALIPDEEGSLLVWPLIDNTGAKSTIIEITNNGEQGVLLQGFMIVKRVGGTDFVKKDFYIYLSPKEPFYWNTSLAYNRTSPDYPPVTTQIQSFDDYVGFCFVFAINNRFQKMEIDWDFLRGDAIVLNGVSAVEYNAIPHQALAIVPNRVLNLDGVEYAAACSQIMTEGYAIGIVAKGGLAICSLNIDFITSIQPRFDINFDVVNQNETPQSRHLDFYQFKVFDAETDLQLTLDEIFTAKWQLAAMSDQPMWAVYYQTVGAYGTAKNVWQAPSSAVTGPVVRNRFLSPLSAPVSVVLPQVSMPSP